MKSAFTMKVFNRRMFSLTRPLHTGSASRPVQTEIPPFCALSSRLSRRLLFPRFVTLFWPFSSHVTPPALGPRYLTAICFIRV